MNKTLCQNALNALLCAGTLTCGAALGNEPDADARVVYPVSATSRNPIAVGPRAGIQPPVGEEEIEEIETPIGQIRTIRGTLDAIADSQSRVEACARRILEIAANAPRDRTDETIGAVQQASQEIAREIRELREQNAQNDEYEAPRFDADDEQSAVGERDGGRDAKAREERKIAQAVGIFALALIAWGVGLGLLSAGRKLGTSLMTKEGQAHGDR